jgi:hypothetical protein
MTLPKGELKVDGWAPEIHGEGSELEITCTITRKTKTGKFQRSTLRLKVERYFVRQMAEQLALMQVRDRRRLEREQERLRHEIKPLTHPVDSGTG